MTDIAPAQFKELWDDPLEPLLTALPEALARLALPPDAVEFLTEAGLPRSVAPFLDFDALQTSRLVPASEMWGIGPEFDNHIVVGSNGSGDPVCLVAPTGELVYLNHDNRFKETLMNTSVARFAACSLVFRELIAATIAQNGETALLDNDIPPEPLAQARQKMLEIDPNAFAPASFWSANFEGMAAGPW